MAKHKWSQQEIDLWRKEHGALGYKNREDRNLFVPRNLGLGWGLNWGNPWSWVILAALVGLVLYGILSGNKLTFHPWRDIIGS